MLVLASSPTFCLEAAVEVDRTVTTCVQSAHAVLCISTFAARQARQWRYTVLSDMASPTAGDKASQRLSTACSSKVFRFYAVGGYTSRYGVHMMHPKRGSLRDARHAGATASSASTWRHWREILQGTPAHYLTLALGSLAYLSLGR